MTTRSRFLIPLIIGLLAAVACAVAAFTPSLRHAFFRAYLFGWFFWLGIALGGMAIAMIHTLTGGDWGRTVRRIGEAASLTLPLLAVLFIPLLFGLPDLYVWMRPDAVAHSDILQHRASYFNLSFFLLRAAAYFIIWIALAFIQITLSRRIERTGDAHTRSVLRGWSAAGLIIYLITMTHAGADWIMSRDVEFFSTTYGLILTTGETLAGTAFAVIVLAISGRRQDLVNATRKGVLIDLGNILLTMVILWTYISFMQLLVIWMGNMGEDNPYYLQRGLGQPSVWRWVGLALVVGHFFIPFFLLLFRATKRYIPTLTAIAALLFVMHIVAVYWLIAPGGDHKGPVFDMSWLDFVAPIAVGGIWLALFALLLPERLAAAAGALQTEQALQDDKGAAHA